MGEWTQNETEFLLQSLGEGKKIVDISALLGRNSRSVYNKVRKLGCGTHHWTDEEMQSLSIYVNQGKGTSEIARLLKRPQDSIQIQCRKLGLYTDRRSKIERQRANNITDHKLCSVCNMVKPLTYEHFRRKNGPCRDCERQSQQMYRSGSLEAVLKSRWRTAKARAEKKEITFNLTLDDLRQKWQSQNGLCHYTQRAMTFSAKDASGVSVDRINSLEGYTPENTVLCCWRVNYMKGDMAEQEFREWCSAVCNGS